MSDQISDTTATDVQEEWRDIPGWEGLYQASSDGQIRSLVRQGKHRLYGGGVLGQRLDVHGYPIVCLNAGGRKKSPKVSVLVCKAFHGEKPLPGRAFHAAHADGDKTNNKPGNLRWATPRENEDDKNVHGTHARGTRNGSSKLTDAEACEIYLATGTLTSIGERFGVHRSVVRRIKDRKCWVKATAIVWRLVRDTAKPS